MLANPACQGKAVPSPGHVHVTEHQMDWSFGVQYLLRLREVACLEYAIAALAERVESWGARSEPGFGFLPHVCVMNADNVVVGAGRDFAQDHRQCG
jgi:hypothetical protein